MPDSTRKARKLWLTITGVLLVFGCVFSILSVYEVYSRYRLRAWPFEEPPIDMVWLTPSDATLRWRFSPGEKLNSLGLKNRELGEKENRVRVLFLGDSLIWSGETSSGELYTQEIETRLNEELATDTDRQIEIINAGIPGYTTYQELEFLRIYGLEMQPDLVVLGFVFNDLYKYLHKPNDKKFLAIDPEVYLHRFNTQSFPGSILSKSYMAHKLVFRLETILKKTVYTSYPFELRSDFSLAWKEFGWKRTTELISEMQDLLNEENVRFMIIVFPVVDQVNPEYLEVDRNYVLYPQQRIEDICATYEIACLDLTDPLFDSGGMSLYRDYLHLNGEGNDVVARILGNYLIANRLDLIGK